MPRKSAQTKATQERYVILIDGDTAEPRYLTNVGGWVRIASLARRFLSKEAAERMVRNLRPQMGDTVEARPEIVD